MRYTHSIGVCLSVIMLSVIMQFINYQCKSYQIEKKLENEAMIFIFIYILILRPNIHFVCVFLINELSSGLWPTKKRNQTLRCISIFVVQYRREVTDKTYERCLMCNRPDNG